MHFAQTLVKRNINIANGFAANGVVNARMNHILCRDGSGWERKIVMSIFSWEPTMIVRPRGHRLGNATCPKDMLRSLPRPEERCLCGSRGGRRKRSLLAV